ncbi:MAG: hypothetical protein MJA27_22920 [Pseudanabaenales cyanobacterium]|nr:hypothetical protein [Pseudanabaenales cyanobacterium]
MVKKSDQKAQSSRKNIEYKGRYRPKYCLGFNGLKWLLHFTTNTQLITLLKPIGQGDFTIVSVIAFTTGALPTR